MKIDIHAFRIKYQVDEEDKYAHYNKGACAVCGWITDQVDASLLWDGLITHLCCDDCYRIFWGNDSY